MCTNASKDGLGGVLTQYGHVSCYDSRNLKEHETNYAVHDMELLAFIHALKIWRHYLARKKCLLLTDNIGLKYVFDQKTLNASQSRRLAFMSEYDFEIRHLKMKENIVGNYLSR